MIKRAFRLAACAAGILAGAIGCAQLGPTAARGHPSLLISVSGEPGPEVPPDFVGLSYEKSFLNLSLFDPDDTSMVTLLRRLRPGVLRVGGNSVDRTSWDPSGPGMRKGLVAPADISRLARFLQAAGWRIIYGLNMGTSTPEAMAEEAAAARAAFGNRLVAFEIGNEPDLYHANNLRGPRYSYVDYLKEWNNDVRFISSLVPGVSFAGPAAAADINGYTIPFSKDTRGKALLLTHHYYRANGELPTSTVGLLLSPDPRLSGLLRSLEEAAVSQDIPLGFRLGETNSFYNGGAPHISDSFASALWAIEFLFECAASGASGVNFHGGGDNPGYTPIADDGQAALDVRPEYYGMYLFSMAAQGRLARADLRDAGPAISAWAVSGRDGSIRVVLVNRSDATNTAINLNVPRTYRSASLLRLTGPSLEAENGTLPGGSRIKSDGSWEKSAEEQVVVRDGSLRVPLGEAGAVLVVVRN